MSIDNFKPVVARASPPRGKPLVNPDVVVFDGVVRKDLGEPVVRPAVHLPMVAVEFAARLQVVEERPQNFVGESVVVALQFGGGERHRLEGVARILDRLAQRSV
jgi:hypothetical protein